VCQVLNIIILCSLIYLDYFLVHKISIYAFIYENRKKKWEKEKDFLTNWALGGFRPSQGARAATRAGGPAGP
jgi:hypothetical protein